MHPDTLLDLHTQNIPMVISSRIPNEVLFYIQGLYEPVASRRQAGA